MKEYKELTTEEKQKLRKRKKVWQVLDRLVGFFIATGLLIVIAGLGFEYVMVKGPSKELKSKFIYTFDETRRFRFINHIFLTDEELKTFDNTEAQMYAAGGNPIEKERISTEGPKTDENGVDAYGLVDDDGDGIIYEEIRYKGSTGYVIVVLDPKRVVLGMPSFYGGNGLLLEQFVENYDAIGGINAGGFLDDGGAGLGGQPDGITIVNGVMYNDDMIGGVAGMDPEGKLCVGYFSPEYCYELNLVDACSFNPVILINGKPVGMDSLESGVNPRTCIGQREDGAIVMIVFDGRQFYSTGVTYADCAAVMIQYGCVNAINMDGGSSSCMYYNGEMKNHPSGAAGGSRYLPNAWLILKEAPSEPRRGIAEVQQP